MGGHLVCHKPCGAQYLTKTEQQCDTDRIALLFYADYVMESTLYQSKCKEIAEKSKKTRRKPEENQKKTRRKPESPHVFDVLLHHTAKQDPIKRK